MKITLKQDFEDIPAGTVLEVSSIFYNCYNVVYEDGSRIVIVQIPKNYCEDDNGEENEQGISLTESFKDGVIKYHEDRSSFMGTLIVDAGKKYVDQLTEYDEKNKKPKKEKE